jgi:hypothetical protein
MSRATSRSVADENSTPWRKRKIRKAVAALAKLEDQTLQNPGIPPILHRADPEVLPRLLTGQSISRGRGYLARGLQASDHVGSYFWSLYGLGAVFGLPAYGYVTDRLAPPSAIRLLLVVQTAALASPAMTNDFAVIGILTVIVGNFPCGIVPMTLGRKRETT